MGSMRVLAYLLMSGGLLSLLLSCSAPGRSFTGAMAETLDIEIMPDTSKMFVYRLRSPDEQLPHLVRIERGSTMGPQDNPGGIKVGRSTDQDLRENAAYVVKQMGYCREGFLEIDSNVSRYHLWLKGECKEGASEADRQAFGEKQTLPVKIQR
ncbi:MAG TPA: hypothetical protein VN030_06325 [Cellvibrio sp.]|nr:hypothetical protein [Cellvibrio sp.]